MNVPEKTNSPTDDDIELLIDAVIIREEFRVHGGRAKREDTKSKKYGRSEPAS